MTDAARRRELIEYIKTSSWNGPTVLQVCNEYPLEDLELFVAGLKGTSPIPLAFRWAWDDDFYIKHDKT